MKIRLSPALIALAVSSQTAQAIRSPFSPSADTVTFHGPVEVEADSLHNIHVSFTPGFEGKVRVVYGDCSTSTPDSHHHEVLVTNVKREAHPSRLVWITPEDVEGEGCLHAFEVESGKKIGRSKKVKRSLKKRQLIADVADELGRWFDGVAYMKGKQNDGVFIHEAKNKKIAIVGAGMSGLMTSFLLNSVGLQNWEIIESSNRLGGRVRTKYFNGTKPEDYQYQEMGPMRFPVSIKYQETGEVLPIKDHELVFHLAEVLNHMNGNDPELAVNFVKWIQSSPNVPTNSRGVRLPDGRIPSAAQVAADPTLRGPAATHDNPEEVALAREKLEEFYGLSDEDMRNIAKDMYGEHKKAVESGRLQWSEANYLYYKLGLSLNTTDFVAGSLSGGGVWGGFYDSVYFAATEWKTIDKGLSQLPKAFTPHVKDKITYGRKITGVSFDEKTKKVSLSWRDEGKEFEMKPESKEYDYAVIAAPFSKVRLWSLPKYSSLLSRAINTMNYSPSCKLALHYKTRFWEHQNPPILGGCGSTDIPGIGSVCYPATNINATGPGVILSSYASGTISRSLGALSEKDHVAMVQRAMVEVHGPIAAEQWTGEYDRVCWEFDEHQAGAWASPYVGQQELYLPAYYHTEFNTIFVGEHTSYTHAWIFSALDSAVRGTTQLLLDLGLVDEAKTIVNASMGRWIKI